MRTLPITARFYVITIWLIAAILMGLTLGSNPPQFDQIPLLLLWLLVFSLADYFEVEFQISDGRGVAMTVVDAAVIFLIAVSGSIGVIVIVIGTFIADALN